MTNITIRNIPKEVIGKIRSSAAINRRSLNSEMIVILEKNVSSDDDNLDTREISQQAKLDIWSRLCGQWKDKRSTQEIINDIYQKRSLGREIDL